MKSELLKILACPDCHTKLVWSDASPSCPKCRQLFPVVRGIPILFSKYSNHIQLEGDNYYGSETTGTRLRKRVPSFLTRTPSTFIKPAKHEVAYNKYVLGAPDSALLLNLGSGSERTGTKERPPGKGTIINLDIFPHSGANVVADGHYLPFEDGTFDGVFMVAVLEHVYNPFEVTREAARVLKPGGFVLVASPFIYPIHSSPSDYFRYTDDGLRQLFPGFREIECVAHGLPTRGLIEFMKAYIAAFTDNRYLAYALSHIVAYLLYPLKYLDWYLQKKERARNVCSSFYYVGSKEPSDQAFKNKEGKTGI